MKPELTHERARKLLDYDPESGVLTWKEDRCNLAKAGSRAGSRKSDGYRYISVDGRLGQEHRLIWFYLHGQWPEGIIDHINGRTDDNRQANLRLVTKVENRQNQRKASKNSRTGFLGVVPSGRSFLSSIQAHGKRYHLGTFKTPEEAHAAYLAAKRQRHSSCTI